MENDFNRKRSPTCINFIDLVDIEKDYAELFDGIGKLGADYEIQIDPSVTPCVHAARRVPFSLQSQLKDKLEDL